MTAIAPVRRNFRWIIKRGTWGVCIIFSCVLLHRASCIDGWWREIVVTGPSMAPTLWGPTHQYSCQACGLPNRYHGQPSQTPPPCWSCGFGIPSTSPRAVPADRVTIDRAAYRWQLAGIPITRSSPQRGDLVAVLVGGQLRVKRVLGVPGDRLAIDRNEPILDAPRHGDDPVHGSELWINDLPVRESLPDAIPTCLVHTATLTAGEHAQATSEPTLRHRWQAIAGGPTNITEDRAPSSANWWVYHHFSIHDRQPDCIRDDYACNVDVRRALHPVKALILRVEVDFPQPSTLDVWFWHPAGPRRLLRHCRAGPQSIRLTSSDATPGNGSPTIPIDPRRPIAVGGLPSSDTAAMKLIVERELYWFVDVRDRSQWPAEPIELAADRFFIAGDNQAISVDSRSDPAGVHRDQIVGKVALW